MQDDGWIIRNSIIWDKPYAMPESIPDRLNCLYELMFLLGKSSRYWFDLNAIRVPHPACPAGAGAVHAPSRRPSAISPGQIPFGGGELRTAVKQLSDPANRDDLCFLLGYASAMTATTRNGTRSASVAH